MLMRYKLRSAIQRDHVFYYLEVYVYTFEHREPLNLKNRTAAAVTSNMADISVQWIALCTVWLHSKCHRCITMHLLAEKSYNLPGIINVIILERSKPKSAVYTESLHMAFPQCEIEFAFCIQFETISDR